MQMDNNGLVKILEGFQTEEGKENFLLRATRVSNIKEAAILLAERYEKRGHITDAAIVLKEGRVIDKELFRSITKKIEKVNPLSAIAIYQNIGMDMEAVEVFKKAFYEQSDCSCFETFVAINEYFPLNFDKVWDKIFELQDYEFIETVMNRYKENKNYKDLAQLYLRTGDKTSALKYFELAKEYESAAKLSLNLKGTKEQKKYEGIGKLYDKLGDYKNALMWSIKTEKNITDEHVEYALKHSLTKLIGKELMKEAKRSNSHQLKDIADQLSRIGWEKESKVIYKTAYRKETAKKDKDKILVAELAEHIGLFNEAMKYYEAYGEFDEAKKMAQKAGLKERVTFYERLETILASSKEVRN